jgi:hypothetical protein
MTRWGAGDILDAAEDAGLDWSEEQALNFLYQIEDSLLDRMNERGGEVIENMLPDPGTEKAATASPRY